uniref:succinate dehydrogenase subunit 3 n=1 Tax=Hydropuntia eucheumatoides TaxID=172970 RepID=UPI002E77A75B|nr:succinate dehydrogenase subunit 3 [Gracilaria eucheumatoides]WPS66069.1 succinate dehydrogenase subunit 3 [Gracilaria eucheumatoides]
MYNRPLAPHITIYTAQSSSLSSIWHRISGLFMIFLVVFSFIFLQIVVCISYKKFWVNFLLFNKYTIYFYILLILMLLFGFFYHAINGLKQILWDLGILINRESVFTFFLSISLGICFIVLRLIF